MAKALRLGEARRHLSSLVFLCLWLLGLGRVFAFDPRTIAWSSIGQEQGFAGGSVSCIMQDQRGLVWIGAAGGLYRYDGHGFKIFKPDSGVNSLTSSSISAILEDRRGDFWVGSDGGGLARYEALSGRFDKLLLSDGPYGEEKASRISALAIDSSGRILAGAADGEVRLVDVEKMEAQAFLHPGKLGEAISTLFVDSRDRIWVGTEGAGLYLYDREGIPVAFYAHDSLRGDSIASDRVSAVIEDSLGFIWIGFADGGIDLFEDGRFRHAKREDSEGNADDEGLPPVIALGEDSRGQIWAGFREGGLGILDPSSMEIAVFPFANEVEVRALMRDRRGLMWTGLTKGGLLTGDFRSTAFSRFVAAPDSSGLGSIQAIAELSSGSMVAASRSGGLFSFNPLSGSLSRMKVQLDEAGPGNVKALLVARDGSLWAGSAGAGLLHILPNGASKRFLHKDGDIDSLSSSFILSILETDDGKLWVGTDGKGLQLFDPVTGIVLRHSIQGGAPEPPPASIITCLMRDSKGRTWVGSADAGLFVLDSGGSRFRAIGRDQRQGGGIGDLRIESVFEDSRGMVWVGSGGGGIAALDPGTGIVIRRGANMGLFADTIYGIAEDKSGILWILSPDGLFSLDPERNDVFLFGAEDGLSGGGLNSGAILVSGSGEVWVGSGEGFTRFDPARIARYAPAPDVVISDIELLGEMTQVVHSPGGSEITLDYDNMGLRYSIAAIDFAAPGRSRYAMRLEGRQAVWTSMGNVNTGYIAPLAPGRYMLRVKAANGNGIWNDDGASLSILVRSPWWGTWWFRMTVVGGAAAAMAGAIAVRLESLRRRNALLVKFARHIEEAREEERTIVARDVHDEIGQHLMVLNLHAYWLAAHPDADPEKRRPVVQGMQSAILDAMASVKAVATRLRPVGLETLDFPDALRWYVRSFGRMSGIKTKLEIGEGWKELSPEAAKTFFRLLQEMLSNVSRHSQAKHVSLRFTAGKDDFTLESKDDGIGIEADKVDAQDSFGIIGMREGCASLGGTLAISGAPGQGCTVTARLPRKPEAGEKRRDKRRKG